MDCELTLIVNEYAFLIDSFSSLGDNLPILKNILELSSARKSQMKLDIDN